MKKVSSINGFKGAEKRRFEGQSPSKRLRPPPRIVIWGVITGLFLLLLAWPGGLVSAHAQLQRSSPPFGAVLTTAPSEVELEFTETIDPGFSTIQLVDSMNMVIVKGPAEMVSGNLYAMRLPLPPLPDGIYSAVWKARSTQDGHVTNGSVSFSVGKTTQLASILPPVGSDTPATALPPLLDTFFRWLTFTGACTLVGAFIFGIAAWRPAYSRLKLFGLVEDTWVLVILRQQIWAAALLTGIASLSLLPAAASQLSQASLITVMAKLLTSQTGLVMAARLILLILLSWWAGRLTAPGSGPSRAWWAGVAGGSGVLLTFSLQSHAAASGSILSVGVDWLHMLGVSTWIGGLIPLGRLLRRGGQYSRLVPFFSLAALISVDTIAASGTYGLLTNATSLAALEQTTYGQMLLIKVVLFFILVLIGAINLLLLSPRLSLAESQAARWLSRNMRAELLLAVFVLFAAGVLTGVAPANQALQAQKRIGYVRTTSTSGVKMTFMVTPGVVGDNEFGLDVSDSRSNAAVDTVIMRLTQLDHNMGEIQIDMKAETTSSASPETVRRYSARGSYLAMIGNWQVDLIVRQPGKDDVTLRYTLQLGNGPQGGRQFANPVVPDAASLTDGKILYQQKCVACHGTSGKGDGPIGRTLYPSPADLTLHTMPGVHSDADLFGWITSGYPGSAMPAFDRTLTDKQRWDLVNFIRTLARKN